MKKITIIITMISIMMSCTKDNIQLRTSDAEYSSPETQRVIDILTDADDFQIISDAPNSNEEPTFTSSHKDQEIYFIFDGVEMHPDENGRIYEISTAFLGYYGTTKEFSIVMDGVEHKQSVYIPKRFKINEQIDFGLNETSYSSVNNIITWEKDDNNKMGVLVNYTLNSGDILGNICGEEISRGNFITKDDGELDVSSIIALNPDAEYLELYIQRGNVASYTYQNKKYAITISSSDGFLCTPIQGAK